MIRIIGETNINFIDRRKVAFAVSALLVAIGAFAGIQIARGEANMAIEFTGGTMVQGAFEAPVQIGDLRTLLADGGFPEAEIKRITGLFAGWLLLILIGGGITALFANLDGWQSFSGMFSAVGNIGPCYFSVQQMSELPAIVKLTYIFGMLAGRLEILPVLLVFSPKAWRR